LQQVPPSAQPLPLGQSGSAQSTLPSQSLSAPSPQLVSFAQSFTPPLAQQVPPPAQAAPAGQSTSEQSMRPSASLS
jgi:hypothetical protein